MIKIRRALLRDIDIIYYWRNDPLSRKFSLNNKAIKRTTHEKWFKSNYKKKHNFYFTCLKGKNEVGFIRYEKKNKDDFLVSILINPYYRGLGFAKVLLKKTQHENSFKKSNLYAKIKKNNIASIKSFINAGYKLDKNLKNYYLFCNKMNYDKVNPVEKINKYQKIINQIEKIRSKNNKNWMDILRIAFKYSPSEAAKVMGQIYKQDKKISDLAKKLEK